MGKELYEVKELPVVRSRLKKDCKWSTTGFCKLKKGTKTRFYTATRIVGK
jgi:hypothetical protein